jgi:superfamily I DNA and RNA helicase
MQPAKGSVLSLSTDCGETWTEIGTLAGEIREVFEEEARSDRVIVVSDDDPRLAASKMFMDLMSMQVATHHVEQNQRTGKGERKRNRKDRWK